MRLAIDISSAAKPDPTGIGRYAVELVRALSKLLSPDDRARLLVKPGRWRDRREIAALTALAGMSGPALLLDLVPGLFSGGAELFHATGVALPRGLRIPAAATVHDVNTIDDPSLASSGFAERRTRKTAKVLARADLVFAVSGFVRDRVLHHFPGFPPERIRVTHHGIDHAGLSPEPDARDREALARLGLADGRPYVLCVGRVEHRKNPEGLVLGFARAKAAAGARLVFAGPVGRSSVDEARGEVALGDRIRLLGRIDDTDLGPLYRGAAAFALPSRYEGFGIPLAEAFACGTPAIASNATALPEVADGAAEIVDLDPDSISAGLDRVLGSPERAAELRARGLARAGELTWARCAERTLEAYRDLLRLGKR